MEGGVIPTLLTREPFQMMPMEILTLLNKISHKRKKESGTRTDDTARKIKRMNRLLSKLAGRVDTIMSMLHMQRK